MRTPRCTLPLLATVLLLASTSLASRLNVLMIAVDDLRPLGGAFGEPEALTPHLDALAARSTIFTNAYAQAATCGVSRASLLTSRRPDTTEVLTNSLCPFDTRAEHKTWVSLPGYFRQNGFATIGLGKIFHPNTCEGAVVGERAAAWSVKPYYHAPCISLGSIYNHTCYESFPGPLPEGPGGKVMSRRTHHCYWTIATRASFLCVRAECLCVLTVFSPSPTPRSRPCTRTPRRGAPRTCPTA